MMAPHSPRAARICKITWAVSGYKRGLIALKLQYMLICISAATTALSSAPFIPSPPQTAATAARPVKYYNLS